MKKLIAIIVLALLGYYAYSHWLRLPQPEPPAEVSTPVAAKPAAPRGAGRVMPRVRRMYEEWKDRALATQKIQQTSRRSDMSVVMTEIRDILGEDFAMHSPGAVKEVVVHCLVGLGVSPSEANYVYTGMLQEVARDGNLNAHDKAE